MPAPALPTATNTAPVPAELAAQAVSTVSGRILRTSWQCLLPSFGLTLIYINIHFLGKYFAHSRWFTAFGSEWMPKVGAQSPGTASGNIALEYGEIILLALLDLLILAAILGIATLLIMIARAIQNPCEFLATVGSAAAALIGPMGIAGSAACAVIGA